MPMKRKDKELLDRAYRDRAFMIGVLHSCSCAFPQVEYPESTGHAIECGAHYMLSRAAGASAEALAVLAAATAANRIARNGGGS